MPKTIIVTNKFVESLFKKYPSLGAQIDGCVKAKRTLLWHSLLDQYCGGWCGDIIYLIMVNGGFLLDGKPGAKKQLTELGKAFLREEDKSQFVELTENPEGERQDA
jgi:hypothetical protein